MGTNDDSNPENNKNKNTQTPKSNGSTMPRAQSNLDILSQTAAVIEEVTLISGSDNTSTTSNSSSSSSPQPARVTPAAEHHHRPQTTHYQIQKTNAYYPIDDQCQKSFLALPEISSSTKNGTTTEFPRNPQPSIFLEKKRGFLPPALSFETGGGMLIGGQPFSLDTSSNYYSPGLYLSYSNGSAVTATSSQGCTNLVAVHRVMSPPQDQVVSKEQLYTTAATVSAGSTSSNGNGGGGGSSPPNGTDGDTAVNSFLANPSNSFSSAGGASMSSSAHIAAVASPLLSQNSLSGTNNYAHLTFPIHNTAFLPSPQQQQQQQRTDNNLGTKSSIEFSDELLRENFLLRQQLAASNTTIASLQNQVELLQTEIRQLRQVPSGKISQIPLEEMLSIMSEYGSEVSDTAMPPRKSYVQKASVVRQFRRWNPNFTEWFVLTNGIWTPKLGPEGEKKRRQEARLAYANKKQKIIASHYTSVKDTVVGTSSMTESMQLVEGKTTTTTTPVPGFHQSESSPVESDGNDVKSTSTMTKIVKNVTEI